MPTPSAPTRARPALPSVGQQVPVFSLYGEPGAPGAVRLHIEVIQSRSTPYRWEIEAHAHRGLHQILWLRAGPAEVWLDEMHQHCQGPLAIVFPCGAVHAFRFAPTSDGYVLTLSPQQLLEGDAPAVGDALRGLFVQPQLLSLDAGAELTARIDAPISRLAFELGFEDPAYFCRLFRRHTGQSPRAYRAAQAAGAA